jgi:molybdopterin converting factor small subunit
VATTNGTISFEYYSWLRKELGVAHDEPKDREGSTITTVPIEDGQTIRELLRGMAAESEPFQRLVYDLEGERLREYVTLIVNGRVVELAGGLDIPLKPGDELLLLPGFSGG